MNIPNNTNGIIPPEQQGFNQAVEVDEPVGIAMPRNIPTLANSMVLVELHHHIPPFRKKDKKRTAKVNADAGAKRKAASVQTVYLECEELTTLKKVKSDHYDWHIGSTIPWLDGGIRGLSHMYLQEYMKESSGWEQLFNEKVEELRDVYAWEVSKEEARMGELYDPSLYPDWEILQVKFGVEVRYMPLPNSKDFRCDIQQDAMDYMQSEYDKHLAERMETGKLDMIKRVIEPVTNLIKMIDYDDYDKPTGFRDSLIPNVEKVLHSMRVANIGDDPVIESARVELERIIGSVSSDTLRESGSLRAMTKKEVQAVMDSLPTL